MSFIAGMTTGALVTWGVTKLVEWRRRRRMLRLFEERLKAETAFMSKVMERMTVEALVKGFSGKGDG